MSDLNLSISGTKRLLTQGKYCDKNIVITTGTDDFWDAYQENGERTDYRGAFSGTGWNDNTFTPKYSIKLKTATGMFAYNAITDLPAALEKAGVTLDFSELAVDGVQQMFMLASTQHIGVLDLSNCTVLSYLLYGCSKLETVDKLLLSDKLTNLHISNFQECPALKNIIFEGTIPMSISFSQSPLLTTASVQSIIDCLKDLTGATAQTLTFHADVGGALTDEQKAAITAKNWTLVY